MFEISNLGLEQRMTIVFEKIPRQKWFFFHKYSMMNFISYLDQVTPEHERLRVEQVILEYVTEVELIQSEDECLINMELSEYLFNNYVSEIIQTFNMSLGFAAVFGRQAYIYIIPVVILLFYLCWQSSLAIAVLIFMLFVFYGRILVKLRKRKIYGFGY